jgi:hypothetical protein
LFRPQQFVTELEGREAENFAKGRVFRHRFGEPDGGRPDRPSRSARD